MPGGAFTIDNRLVGGGARPLVIGEVAQAHDGSLGLAHAFVDAIADAGADAVKFQTHIAEAESTRDEPFRVPFSDQDSSRYDYWARTSFSEDQWRGLADHARERGLIFLSTPFSLEAVALLDRVGVPAWKIGSGDIGTEPLLDAVAATGRPVLLSSGMSSLAQLDAAVERVRAASPFAVLQCTSAYPTPTEEVGLNLIGLLADRYEAPVGLSDHSGTIYPALAAVALGASIVEVHVTLSRHMFGPDVAASVSVEELTQLVSGADLIGRALASPVDKDAAAERLSEMRDLFTRSVAPVTDLAAGTELTADQLTLKKPGTGIPASKLPELVGRRLLRDVQADQLLREDDLE
jgi:N-acetylneuraminate synthase